MENELEKMTSADSHFHLVILSSCHLVTLSAIAALFRMGYIRRAEMVCAEGRGQEDRACPFWKCGDWSSTTDAARSWMASILTSTPAKSSACLGRTAPAKPPASA